VSAPRKARTHRAPASHMAAIFIQAHHNAKYMARGDPRGQSYTRHANIMCASATVVPAPFRPVPLPVPLRPVPRAYAPCSQLLAVRVLTTTPAVTVCWCCNKIDFSLTRIS
jgi:hypothetical protein